MRLLIVLLCAACGGGASRPAPTTPPPTPSPPVEPPAEAEPEPEPPDEAELGHGAGTGTGAGLTGRRARVPTLSIGQPSSQGDLDKAIIRRYIKRDLARLMSCYEKELAAKPTLSGTVHAQFMIDPSGKVSSSTASGVDANVATCVAAMIARIVFPKPKNGGSVQVTYPFIYHQSGGR